MISRFRVLSKNLFQQPKFGLVKFLSTDTKQVIEKAINAQSVCLFMKGTPDYPQCGFSRAAVAILNMQGIDTFSSVNVLEDEEIRSGIKEYSSWPTIPQLYIKGEFIGGCDILMQMHQNGELEKMLLEKGIVEPNNEG
ncbi:monothiol glutaredoxin [Neoconidiobolus thromboides FSU 785]|nr:monothiol glutaredoxin [Neoconidiobolus thromboides FSU 785]